MRICDRCKKKLSNPYYCIAKFTKEKGQPTGTEFIEDICEGCYKKSKPAEV